jgi:hypothetical protein
MKQKLLPLEGGRLGGGARTITPPALLRAADSPLEGE